MDVYGTRLLLASVMAALALFPGGSSLALAPSATAVSPSVNAPNQTTVSAHRGGAGLWPENSVKAFKSALAAGYTDIEMDTWVTRDGRVVIWHGSTFRASLGCSGPYLEVPLNDLSSGQVALMRCNAQPIATLAEVLDLTRNATATLRVEVKHQTGSTPAARRSAMATTLQQIARAGATSRSIVADFEWVDTFATAKSVAPSQRLSALMRTDPTWAQVAAAKASGAIDVSYNAKYLKRVTNRVIAEHNLTSSVWTVDDPVVMRRAQTFGVDVLITNRPDVAARELAVAVPLSSCTVVKTPLQPTKIDRGWRGNWYITPVGVPAGVDELLVEYTTGTTAAANLMLGPSGSPYTTSWESPSSIPAGATLRASLTFGADGAARVRNTSSTGGYASVYIVGYVTRKC